MRRLVFILCVLAFLYNVGGVIYWLSLPSQAVLASNLSRNVQIVIGVTWALLFAYCSMKLVVDTFFGEQRVTWILSGFIMYSVFRLLLFSRSDYDRERFPLLLIGFGTIIFVLAVRQWILRSLQRREFAESKENLTDDR